MPDNCGWNGHGSVTSTGRLVTTIAAKHSSEKQDSGKPKQTAEGCSERTPPDKICAVINFLLVYSRQIMFLPCLIESGDD